MCQCVSVYIHLYTYIGHTISNGRQWEFLNVVNITNLVRQMSHETELRYKENRNIHKRLFSSYLLGTEDLLLFLFSNFFKPAGGFNINHDRAVTPKPEAAGSQISSNL